VKFYVPNKKLVNRTYFKKDTFKKYGKFNIVKFSRQNTFKNFKKSNKNPLRKFKLLKRFRF